MELRTLITFGFRKKARVWGLSDASLDWSTSGSVSNSESSWVSKFLMQQRQELAPTFERHKLSNNLPKLIIVFPISFNKENTIWNARFLSWIYIKIHWGMTQESLGGEKWVKTQVSRGDQMFEKGCSFIVIKYDQLLVDFCHVMRYKRQVRGHLVSCGYVLYNWSTNL